MFHSKKELVLSQLLPGGNEENHNNLKSDGWPLELDLNPKPTEYKAGVITI
jgi:hypothetical protein